MSRFNCGPSIGGQRDKTRHVFVRALGRKPTPLIRDGCEEIWHSSLMSTLSPGFATITAGRIARILVLLALLLGALEGVAAAEPVIGNEFDVDAPVGEPDSNKGAEALDVASNGHESLAVWLTILSNGDSPFSL